MVHPQQLGQVALLEAVDHLLLEIAKWPLHIGPRRVRAGLGQCHVGVLDGRGGADDHRLVHLVLELSHVPGKVVAGEPRERGRRDSLDRLAEPCAVLLHEVMHEHHDVLGPLAQRRQVHREHVDPVVQILAKIPRGDECVEITIRRGDDTHVDAPVRVVADAAELLALQDAEDLRLQGQRHLADLVEEQRARVRRGEEAFAIARRIGERAAHVPE